MVLDEIISIKKVGVKPTVDIEVDGDHLFYCNNILAHNSAAGDTAEISEDNIQGGISKIQSADNVLAFIPNSQSRALSIMKAKWLKSRDSGAVGHYISFEIDWSTLTFKPTSNDDDEGSTASTTNYNPSSTKKAKKVEDTMSEAMETKKKEKKLPFGKNRLGANNKKRLKKEKLNADLELDSGEEELENIKLA